MIIRKNSSTSKKEKSSNNSKVSNSSKNIIKKGGVLSSAEIEKEQILDSENVENSNKDNLPIKPTPPKQVKDEAIEETFEKIDISSIEFKERVERRRGDRRRGYRRIDERSLVSRAQQEAHNIKELAAREGYQQGLLKAQGEITEIKDALIEFLAMRDSMYEEFYPHVMEISMEIAKKIIKQEVQTSQDVLKNVIISALDEVNQDTQKIIVKVNPDDVEFASVSLPEIIEVKAKGIKFSVAADEQIEQGSCMIVANNGVIDANFRTQLAILQTAFGIYKGGL